ncbi:DIS3-like exonuclease 2 [Desmophyllum pertusum]|uniref:DIS3-like exonuclease 2 n=1 Tax=Desmophyllum pertusum TaxID=174260 RepID=A0A9W9YJY0_9CNID|nr:DIS3-like exonuclease 2 [Desmophyllum pertusum]
MDLNAKEPNASGEEGEEEVVEATDCIRPPVSNARAEENDARANLSDRDSRSTKAKEEASLTQTVQANGHENAEEEIEAGGNEVQSQKKKRKRRKKKKHDSETASEASATSAGTSCDAIKEEGDVTQTTSPDSAKQVNHDCADKGVDEQNRVHSEATTSQDQADDTKKRRSRRKRGKSAQLSEETPLVQEDMAKGGDVSSNLPAEGGKEERQDLLTPENASSGKKKRNRRRKGNKGHHDGDSLEASGGMSLDNSARKDWHHSEPRNGNQHQVQGSERDSETRSTNHVTPKSHERSARRNSPHRTPNIIKTAGNKRRPLYDQHWSVEKVSAGLKRGELVKGVLRISPRNYELAWVTVPGLKRDVVLEGMLRRNRALNGDVVALEILPRDKWKVMKEELDYSGVTVRDADHNHASVDNVTEKLDSLSMSPGNSTQSPVTPTVHTPGTPHKDRIDIDKIPEQFLQRTGKVVHIIEKKHSRVASGHLKPFTHPKECPDGLFSPTDSRLPRIRIMRENCPPGFFDRPRDFENTLLVARIESPWKIPEKELDYRRDFREDCIFTIDPLTARDLDDAVHCKKLEDGLFEVGVHIADVSFFVRRGTALDEVAAERGTSTYMVQKVVPMLPRRLCEELCSLNPGEDRLTFSVVWQMSDKGEILDEWKGRGIIRSRVKMAYEHAQDMIDKPNRKWNLNELPPISDGASVEEISAQVNQLHKFALRLRRNRFENGALRLDQVKIRFDLDKETGLPNGYHVHKQREANQLIEEFMLLANMAVAHHIYGAYPETALLRRHPKPHQKQLDDLIELCKSFGIRFNATSSKTIHESLAQFPLSSPEREVLVNLTMRPMKNAEYFCTGP